MSDITQEERSYLDRFKDAINSFKQAYQRLMNIDMSNINNPQLQREHSALTKKAQSIKSTVEKITKTIDGVVGWFGDMFGLSDVPDHAIDGINNYNPHSPMGIAFLIPIAAIAGALSLIGKFVSDVYLFERKVTEQKRLEVMIGPEKAASVIAKLDSHSLFNLSNVGTVGVLAGVGFVLYKLFNKR